MKFFFFFFASLWAKGREQRERDEKTDKKVRENAILSSHLKLRKKINKRTEKVKILFKNINKWGCCRYFVFLINYLAVQNK